MRIITLAFVVGTGCNASKSSYNGLIGPVLGVRLGGPAGPRSVVGVEGGIGWGPERVNFGFERRVGMSSLYYFELDPWFIVGASLGLGLEQPDVGSLRPRPLVGIWEGVIAPLEKPADCLDVPDDRHYYPTITVSVGYRYSGVHTIYFAPKFGGVQKPEFCE